MADLSVTNYERALDDITRRGISAIRSTHRPTDPAFLRTTRTRRRAAGTNEKAPDQAHGAILQAIKVRPYTTLAIAGLIGFACGALRR